MSCFPILKKELKSYLTSPVIYVVLTVFLVISGYYFYTNLLMVVMFQGSNINVNIWQYTFNDVRFVLMIMVPLISMRVFAEEKRLGTIELLITSPLQNFEIILGKYFACLAVLTGMLLLTLFNPVIFETLFHQGKGPVFTGYLGLFLLGASFLSCGFFISSLTEKQIIAAVATLGVVFFFWFIDQYSEITEELFIGPLRYLSLSKHFYNFNRGVINTKDVVFYITVSIFFLFLTFLSLGFHRRNRSPINIAGHVFSNIHIWQMSLTGKLLACCIIILLFNISAARFNRRFDLSPGKIFTLAPLSHEVLTSLKESLHVSVYHGKQERLLYEELLDLMAQSSRYFSYELIDIERNPASAQALGTKTRGAGAAEYEGRKEIIPSVTEASLIKAILVLKQGKEKIVRFVRDYASAEKHDNQTDLYQQAKESLIRNGFRILDFVPDPQKGIPPDTTLLVITSTTGDIPENHGNIINNFFRNDGRILFMLDTGTLPNISRILKAYNIDLGDDIIIDKQHTSYEFDERTPIIHLNREHPISKDIGALVIFPRARSVQVGLNPKPDLSWTILAQSGRRAWAESSMESAMNGTSEYDSGTKDVYGPVPSGIAVQIRKAYKQMKTGGRMIVLGNSLFITDRYFSMIGNKDFFMSTINWLAEQKTFFPDIPKQQMVPTVRPIHLTEQTSRFFFWFPIVIEPFLIFCIGAGVLLRRRLRSG